jgi:hypothetical protein
MTIDDLRRTSDNSLAGIVRLFLAALFLMTGVMKLAVPMLADAFSGQLLAAGLPFYALGRWTVPIVEILLGFVLAVGLLVRPAAVVVTRRAGHTTRRDRDEWLPAVARGRRLEPRSESYGFFLLTEFCGYGVPVTDCAS